MVNEAARQALAAIGLALFILAGVVVPLRAAAPEPLPGLQEGDDMVLELEPARQTVKVGQTTALTATLRNDSSISVTSVYLTVTISPEGSISSTSSLTSYWPYIGSGVTETCPISLSVSDQASGTLGVTAALRYSIQEQDISSVFDFLLFLRGYWVCLIPLLLFLALLLALIIVRRRIRDRSAAPEPSPTAPLPGPCLEYVDASGRSHVFDLDPGGVTVGRAPDNDLVIPQDTPERETVSRRHARIYREGGRWIIEDLDSTNGIYVGGRRTGRNILRDGWEVGVGGVKFTFRDIAEEAQ